MTRSTTREPERRRLVERPRRRRDGEVEGLGFLSSLSASVDFSLEGDWDAMATVEKPAPMPIDRTPMRRMKNTREHKLDTVIWAAKRQHFLLIAFTI